MLRIIHSGQYTCRWSCSLYINASCAIIATRGDLALKPVQIISFPLVAVMLPGAIGMFPWGQI